jgi:hypothetical protein
MNSEFLCQSNKTGGANQKQNGSESEVQKALRNDVLRQRGHTHNLNN